MVDSNVYVLNIEEIVTYLIPSPMAYDLAKGNI